MPKQMGSMPAPRDVAQKKSHDSVLRKTNPTKSVTPGQMGRTTGKGQMK